MTEPTMEFAQAVPKPEAAGLFETPDHKQSRTVPPGVTKVFSKLGNNKKARGGPRPLKPTDLVKLEDYYQMMAFAVNPFKPQVADAIMAEVNIPSEIEGGEGTVTTRAHMCAESWYDLAQENDSVRRMLLGLIETGAWSKVLMANMPILLAALPDDFLMRMTMKFMPFPAPNFGAEEQRAA